MTGEQLQGRGVVRLHDFVRKHRNAILACLLAAACAAVLAIRLLPFDHTLDLMLPDDAELHRAIGFLRSANFADKVAVSLSLTDPAADTDKLAAAMDDFAASVEPPLISEVISKFDESAMMEDLLFFLEEAPQILDAHDLAEIEKLLTPAAVEKRLKERYRQLLKPQGSFMSRTIRADPLAIKAMVLTRIRGISASFGYDVDFRDGRLVSRDGRHGLLILRTPVHLADAGASRRLVHYLREKLAAIPAGVEGEMVCGHTHTVSNEDAIKRDIRLTLTIASVAFFLLFLLYFRDASAGLIFLIPIVSVVVSLNVTSLLVGALSSFVVGLGSVIAGIAVDYGIHVYVGVRQGTDASDSARRLARPVTLGALTTLSVFIAFLLSGVPGYRQLAWFSTVSVVISLGLALFVLPHCIRPRARSVPRDSLLVRWVAPSRDSSVVVLLLFAVVLAVGVVAAVRVRFDSDLAQLDGVSREIVETEERFKQKWGGGEGSQAMVVASAADHASAMELNDMVYAAATAGMGRGKLISLASVWPSASTRTVNAARWAGFWQDGREATLRRLLAEKGRQYSFSDQAFAPFFQDLYQVAGPETEPGENAVLTSLKERFVQELAGEWRVVSFFPDTDDLLAAMDAIGARQEGVFVVSRRHLSALLSRLVISEMGRITTVAMILILATTWWLLRSVRTAVIALVPAVTGVIWLAGAVSLLGMKLNVTNLIAGIVVVGLCIDYGIFVAYACAGRLDAGAVTSVSLSAATTVVGAGALLFARHPALFSIGVTLVAGVFAGYLAAVLVVPSLHAVLVRDRKNPPGDSPLSAVRRLSSVLAAATAAALCIGCVAPSPFEPVERVPVADMTPAEVRAAFAKTVSEQYKLANSAVFHIRGRQMTGVGYVAVDAKKRSFAVACMSPLGLSLFDITSTNDAIKCNLAIADVPHKDAFARVVAADVRDIYFDLVPANDAEARKTRNTIVFRRSGTEGRIEHIFAGADGMLVEKRSGRRRIRYYDYVDKNGRRFPRGIVLDNGKYRYRLVLRLKEVLEIGVLE